MSDEVTLRKDDLAKLYKYALAHCRELCPAERDAETCVIMFELGKILGIRPPCADDYGDLSEDSMKRMVSEIEGRYGKALRDFLREVKKRGPRHLQEQVDTMDAEFALEVLEVLKKRKRKD